MGPLFCYNLCGGDPMILALGIFAPEVKPIIDQMHVIESGEILGRSYSRGVIGNNEVVACSGFVGKVETAFVTQKLIDFFQPRLALLLSGAAALDKSLNPGDLVIGTEFEEYDTFFPLSQDKMSIKAPDNLVMRFLKIYFKDGKFGKIISGDGVVYSAEERDRIASSHRALALDMDSAAFAKMAHENNQSFVVIKTILDMADENTQRDFDRNFPIFCGKPARLMVELMKTHYIDR